MIKLKVYLKIFYLCIRSCFQLNLGDTVRFAKRRWVISNGVSRPHWCLMLLDDGYHVADVHEKYFRKEFSLGNIIYDLSSTYRFYKGYWFDIWVRAEQWDVKAIQAMRHMPRK